MECALLSVKILQVTELYRDGDPFRRLASLEHVQDDVKWIDRFCCDHKGSCCRDFFSLAHDAKGIFSIDDRRSGRQQEYSFVRTQLKCLGVFDPAHLHTDSLGGKIAQMPF